MVNNVLGTNSLALGMGFVIKCGLETQIGQNLYWEWDGIHL